MTTEALQHSWHIFQKAGGVWLERNAFVHAGSLAFYTLFSMAPVVIIAVSIAGAVFGEEAARGEIVAGLGEFVGSDAARAIEEAVARSRPDVAGLLPSVTGILALILGATTVFAQMQISLNRIWGVASRPQTSSIAILVKNRVLSFAIILTIGFILLVSLLLNVALRTVVTYAEGWVPVPTVLLSGAELVLSLVVITVLFAVIFKVLPDAIIGWRDVWVGAAISAALFVTGRYLIAGYLTYTAPESAYGAAGSLVLVLLWVYYSSLILFFGAALTKARVLASGKGVVARPQAVRLHEEIVEEAPPDAARATDQRAVAHAPADEPRDSGARLATAGPIAYSLNSNYQSRSGHMTNAGEKVKETIVSTIKGTGEIVNAVTETVSGSLTTALQGTGAVGKALTGTVADVASGVIQGTSQVGGDLGNAAKGTVLGVLHGTKEVGGEAASAVGSTLRAIVATTAQVGGDVGSAARGAMEGVIEGTRSVGETGVDAVTAGVAGAIQGIGEVGAAATTTAAAMAHQVIRGAFTLGGDLGAAAKGATLGVLRGTRDVTGQTAETLSATAGSVVKATAEVGGDVAATAKAAVEGAIQGATETGTDVAAAASAAASGALKAAGDISTAAVEQVQRAATGVISGVKVVVAAPFQK